ncbi:hypothetical protein OFC56_34090, partial [Escherichia coli]|nr:hypothetical protein [Escherichia coli]
QQEAEVVIARDIVKLPFYVGEDRSSEDFNNTLPSVTFNLPSVVDKSMVVSLNDEQEFVVGDGFYGLRVQFFVKDYLKANERLQNEVPE